MSKTVFAVLHFLSPETTIRAVDLILSLPLNNYGEVRVVIADNHSPDGSGPLLMDHYCSDSRVDVLLLKENMGFARGNNEAFRWIRDKYDPDYLVFMNNDVLIDQSDFLETLDRIYAHEPFDVLGPDIRCPDGTHQNPAHLKGFTKKELVLRKRRNQLRNRFFPVAFFLDRIRGLYRKTEAALLKKNSRPKRSAPPAVQDAVLHGACMVFSARFCRAREYAFHPGTFLYFEEEILWLECHTGGFRMCYDPSLRVTHLNDVSSDAYWRSLYRKEKFKNEQIGHSLDIMLDLYDRSGVRDGQ